MIDESFAGRTWNVSVTEYGEAKAAERATDEFLKREKEKLRDQEDEQAVLTALRKLNGNKSCISKNKVRDLANLSGTRACSAMGRLEDKEKVVLTTMANPGKGPKFIDGIRLLDTRTETAAQSESHEDTDTRTRTGPP
jgi:hypothetical protein